METLKVDLKGLRGGALEWSKENHFRTRQYYGVYKWDPAGSKVLCRVKELGRVRRRIVSMRACPPVGFSPPAGLARTLSPSDPELAECSFSSTSSSWRPSTR